MKSWISIGIAAALVAGTAAAQPNPANLTTALANCAAILDGPARLNCFDAVAAELGATATDQLVVEYRGANNQTTRPFSVDGPWEIQWQPGDGLFAIWIYHADGRRMDLAANQINAGPGTAFQPAGGEFYLEITGREPWVVRIVRVGTTP